MEKKRVALITGVTGQDGSYLADLLLDGNWEVYGGVRRVAAERQEDRFRRINHLLDRPNFNLVPLDVTCYENCLSTIATVSPDHIYHLAANSFVASSFNTEHDVFRVNEQGTLNMLRATKEVCPSARFYFAGTSEQFGNQPSPQYEGTPMRPVSPYGISKTAAYHLCRYFRDRYAMFVTCGILFNHESPRRGDEFVTRKITRGVAKLAKYAGGPIPYLTLGNLEAKRDWGYAPDYVRGMRLMMEYGQPDDFVLATGVTWSIREFLETAFYFAGANPENKDSPGLFRWLTPSACVDKYVKIDKQFYRPNEVHELKGNAWRAHEKLGWEAKVTLDRLVDKMVVHDLRLEGGDPF